MVIGQYRILNQIGEGGMGVIYKAEHCALEQVVAIKSLSVHLALNADLRERFIREAKIQAKLSHPNVVNILNFFELGEKSYIVMEYVEGETLESLIETRGLLPPDSCIGMFKQILAGTGYAHSKGIIHRDIKPANIIIKHDGTVKITDFGIAKIADDVRHTQTGAKVGTIWYMSPEQVKGQPATVFSDIYSLGVTLFEMVTGKVPFSGSSEYSIMKEIVESPPPSPRDVYPYVPLPLERVIQKAMAKDPQDRFRTVEEFEAALTCPKKVFLDSPTGVVSTTGRWNSFISAASMNSRTMLAALAAAVTVVILIIAFSKSGTGHAVYVANLAPDAPPPVPQAPVAQDFIPPTGDTAAEVTSERRNKPVRPPQDQRGEGAETAGPKTKAIHNSDEAAPAAAKKKSARISTLLTAARKYHSIGNYKKAVETYKKILGVDAGNTAATRGIKDAEIARKAEEAIGTLK